MATARPPGRHPGVMKALAVYADSREVKPPDRPRAIEKCERAAGDRSTITLACHRRRRAPVQVYNPMQARVMPASHPIHTIGGHSTSHGGQNGATETARRNSRVSADAAHRHDDGDGSRPGRSSR